MDVASASAMQQEMTALKVQMSVMKKTLSVEKSIGEAIIGLLDSALEAAPRGGKTEGIGENIDVTG
ncbi:MAG: YjfB family protein [Thermoguttaceae bacterium]